jgi:hypothetical protein
MTVKLGLAYGSQTLWFQSDPWFVPEDGLRVEYGEDELRFTVTLAGKGSLSSLSAALRNLRSLVRSIDRGGGSLLIDDGVEIASYPIRDAQLQELPQRLELWPSGYTRVTLVLRCDAESVSATAQTLLEQFVTETGQPVVIDPEGSAILGLRVAPYEEPLPAAIEAYVMDGEYTASDLIVPLGDPQYDNGTYIYDAEYEPPAPEVDVYAEVTGPPAAPTLAITGVQAIPPFQRLTALVEPPAALAGSWQANDCVVVVAKQRQQPNWVHDGGYVHARQLSSAATSVPLPPAHMVVALRGATLLGVVQRSVRQVDTIWPSTGVLTCSLPVTLPSLPANHRYVVYGVRSGMFFVDTTTKQIRTYGFPNVQASGLTDTGYVLRWQFNDLIEMTGTSSSVTFSWRVGLDMTPPDDFAGIVKTLSVDLAVFAVPDSAFSTLPAGDYRVAVVGYQGTTPVVAVQYEQFVRVPSGYRLRVDFDSRDPSITHKVFVQRVGTAQWYSTSATPPSVTLSTLGTAESMPSVAGSGTRETITVTSRPADVPYPVQERSAAYVAGGRKLIPVGRLSFHPGEQYAVRVTSRHPVYRFWALPRPRTAILGAYVIASALLESARQQGLQTVRVASSADIQSATVANDQYTRPWFMLSTTVYPPGAQFVVATMDDGSGFLSPANVTPLTVTHPVAGIPLVATSVGSSRVPIAYYHESSGNLASGRTIGAAVYLYNASTSNRTVTVYLEDSRTSSWQEQSTTVTIPAGSYAYTFLQLTLNASVPAMVVALQASSTVTVYANVVWVVGSWANVPIRRSFYDTDWRTVHGAVWAGPRFYGWDITMKYIPGHNPSTPHWTRTQSRSFTGSESNTTYDMGWAGPCYLVRAGQQYIGNVAISAPSGYTASGAINYPGGSAGNNTTFTPTADGACTFTASVSKSTSSGGTVSVTFSSLRKAGSTNELGRLSQAAPGNILRLGWPQSASSWLIAARIVYRHDAVTGRFMRIPLASGDPLDLEFSGANIVAKRGSTTLLTLARPSTSPTTLRVSYTPGTLTLSIGEPGSWSSVSTNVSLPAVDGMIELDGAQTRGEWGVRWLGLVAGPSSAMLAGTHSLFGSNHGAYSVFLNESSYAYWWAEEPYYVYRPGNIVLGVQRGVLEVSGKCTLVVFPISSIETRDILDRSFILDVLGYEKR